MPVDHWKCLEYDALLHADTLGTSWDLRGNANVGNTCYLNSANQALVAVPEVAQFFATLPAECPCCADAARCPIRAIATYFRTLGSPSTSPAEDVEPLVPPRVLLTALGRAKIQHDPDEYILVVIGRIINEHCRCTSRSHESAGFRAHIADLRCATAGTGNCPGGCESEHVNIVTTQEGVFQLPIRPGASLAELFADFICDETIAEVDCNECGTKREVEQTQTILHPPNVLMFNFKRFDDAMRKINGFVPFESEIDIGGLLRWNPTTRDAFREAGGVVDRTYPVLIYELCAITVHVGNSRKGGHHVSYARRRCPDGRGRWFSFNDSQVGEVSQIEVLSAEAQTLFYRAVRPELVAALRALPATGRHSIAIVDIDDDDDASQAPSSSRSSIPDQLALEGLDNTLPAITSGSSIPGGEQDEEGFRRKPAPGTKRAKDLSAQRRAASIAKARSAKIAAVQRLSKYT